MFSLPFPALQSEFSKKFQIGENSYVIELQQRGTKMAVLERSQGKETVEFRYLEDFEADICHPR